MDTPCPDLGGPEMADRYKRLATPASAVVMVGGVVTAFLMPQPPDTPASGQTVIAFFRAHHPAMSVAAFSVAYAAVAAVLFFVSVAYYLRTRGSQILAATTAVGGVVFASGALLGAGLLVSANDAPGRMTADVAKTLNILQDDAFFLAVIAGLGISFLSIGVASLRTKALPKWLGIVTTIVGVVALSGIGSWFGFMASGLLTLVVAGYVYQALGRPTEITMPDIPAQATAPTTTQVKA